MKELEHDEASALLCLILEHTGDVVVSQSDIEKFDGGTTVVFIESNGDDTFTIGLKHE